MKQPKVILITGASSGLGRALALEYAKEEVVLLLVGRNPERLAEISSLCNEKKALVVTKILDVRKKEEFKDWLEEMGKNYGLDLAIINAGISAGTASGVENYQQVKEIFATNVDSAIHNIDSVIQIIQAKNPSKVNSLKVKGQIALISSLAGFRGLPSAPAYSASKAAIRVYGEGLRGLLSRENIEVNIVCPGYIKTPLTEVNNFYMPFLMEAGKAAKIIKKGLKNNRSRIAFPWPLYLMIWLCALLPPYITDPIFARLPGKSALKSS